MMNKTLLACLMLPGLLFSCPQETDLPFRNAALAIERRIDDLLSRLTPEEKASQLLYNSPAVERLGIPAYNWWNECLHGVARAGRATVFPQAIGLAAAFDDRLVFRVADAISTEARAKHNEAVKKNHRAQYAGLSFWTPNINIFRDPRWGRGQETYGEDPYLTGRMGSAFVRGLQGSDSRALKAAACAKHFAVHSGPENTRHESNVRPSEKDFRETYLPAFKSLVDAGVEAVMCAYNRLYDDPCCGSDALLKVILREEWGFRGHIVSDCWALDDFWKRHKVAATEEEAVAMAAKAGVNLECGVAYRLLLDVIRHGWIRAEELDSLLRPLLRTRFKLGLFNLPEEAPFASVGPEVVNCEEHRALAYEAAVKSVVLLKNERGLLPLDKKKIKNIFVAGPTAADLQALVGNYNGWSGGMITLLEGIVEAVDAGTVVDYSLGCQMNTPGKHYGFWEAKMADIIILGLGNSKMMEGEEGEALLNPEGGDRADIRLPESQREFARLMRERAPRTPIVAVVTGGSAVALQDVFDAADAVLFAWYPGEQGGRAVADILFGDAAPSGRLPVTFYKSADDLPPFEDYSMEGRTYKYFGGEPLFPFGYGLSYTEFAYEGAATDKPSYQEGEKIAFHLTVRNRGNRAGEEVVMVYASRPQGSGAPPDASLSFGKKRLVGFARVFLDPGESRSIAMEIDLLDTYQWDAYGKRYLVDEGLYVLEAAPCGGEGVSAALSIK